VGAGRQETRLIKARGVLHVARRADAEDWRRRGGRGEEEEEEEGGGGGGGADEEEGGEEEEEDLAAEGREVAAQVVRLHQDQDAAMQGGPEGSIGPALWLAM
jgi:hypothetical protein